MFERRQKTCSRNILESRKNFFFNWKFHFKIVVFEFNRCSILLRMCFAQPVNFKRSSALDIQIILRQNSFFSRLNWITYFAEITPPPPKVSAHQRQWFFKGGSTQNRRQIRYMYLYQVRTIFWHNRWSGAVPHVSNRMKRSNLQKGNKTLLLFWGVKTYSVLGCAGERISLRCRQVTSKVPKIVKNLFVLQFCSWDGSFRRGEMKIWLCLYFQHVMRYIGTDFVEESRREMQRSEKEHIFGEGCFDRKEYISNTANKPCSRQVLQLRCSSWYSIKFYT